MSKEYREQLDAMWEKFDEDHNGRMTRREYRKMEEAGDEMMRKVLSEEEMPDFSRG